MKPIFQSITLGRTMKNASPRDYSIIAPIYDHVFNRPLSEGHRKIGELLNSKKNKKGLKILEVGVGSGLTLSYLPTSVEFTGIDVNDRMLSLARQKSKSLRRRSINLQVMNAENLEFKDNSYDLVLAPSVLSAMDTPLKGLREMIRVTKKGGHIAIITNLRNRNSMRSNMVRLFDPLTRKYLGFRTDMDSAMFERLKGLKLIEHKQVNNFLGFPLSSYLLFEKR